MTTKTSTTTIDEISRLHGEFNGLSKEALAVVLRIGELLFEQKAKLGHGSWGAWVSDNLPFTARTASKYLRLHAERERLKSENVSDLAEAYRPLTDGVGDEVAKSERRQKLEELEQELQATLRVMGALLVVRDEKLYRGDFDTFEEYLLERWGITSTKFELRQTWYAEFKAAQRGQWSMPEVTEPAVDGEHRPDAAAAASDAKVGAE